MCDKNNAFAYISCTRNLKEKFCKSPLLNVTKKKFSSTSSIYGTRFTIKNLTEIIIRTFMHNNKKKRSYSA